MPSEYRDSVLIVDDVSTVREFLRQTLRRVGVTRVEEAANVSQALRAFNTHKHDIVFLDIELPDGDGTSLIEAFLGISPSATIIMLSAFSTVDNVKFALKHGAKGFIVKPFSPVKIQTIMSKFGTARAS